MMDGGQWKAAHKKLKEPFPLDQIGFLPKGHSGDQVLAIPYLDSRDLMERLDDVVGAGNWSFDWQPMAAEGVAVKGILTVAGVTRSDVGESGADDDSKWKSAVTDAFKRCAVQFGLGRYLKSLPNIWVKSKEVSRNGKTHYVIADLKEAYSNFAQLTGQTAELKQSGQRQTEQSAAKSFDPPKACVDCGGELTKAQAVLSVNKYGRGLCVKCQLTAKSTGG